MIGQTISHYTILERLGEGGMGVVYKARDTKLDRDVALKFLPAHLASSERDKARFVQEAKAAATLNHPNICTIHDIGEEPGPEGTEARMFIVMECVQGQTLQERKASLSMRQAIDIGIQVAEGLAAAHEKGIVHRDVKPENIMLRKDGIAQVMDFGLARIRTSRNTRLTKEGSTVGTAGYMSPEQVQGQDTDHRSDIFSLGVLLYEMFTGRMPFQGVHETAIHYEVVNVDPPPPSSLKPELDPEIDRIVLECLQKDPDERYNAVKDVAKDLKRFKRESSRERVSGVTRVNRSAIRQSAAGERAVNGPGVSGADRRSGKSMAWPAIAALSLAAAAVMTYLYLGNGRDAPAVVTKFSLALDPGQALANSTVAIDISADGRTIAFITEGVQGEGRKVCIRRMDELSARPVPGTDNAFDVSLSPDGEWLAFSTDGKVKKIPVRGGSAVTLASAPATRGIDWGEGNRIVYTPNPGSPVFMVSADGGEATAVTALDSAAGEASHRLPEVLPGGEAILFTVKTKFMSAFSEAKIAVQRLDSKDKKILIDGGAYARYVTSGHLLYARGSALYLAPFDPATLELKGPSEVILDSAGMLNESFGYFTGAVSANGTLIYAPGGPLPVVQNELTLHDRTGRIVPFLGTRGAFGAFSISPDRRRVAAQIFAANDDIWIYDVERQLPTRFTFAGGNNWNPLWAPDGKDLAYTSEQNGAPNLFLKSADGSGSERQIARSTFRQWARSFTPDGKILIVEQVNADGNSDLWTLSIDDGNSMKPILESRFNERFGTISPDGRWMAYTSDESGSGEIYVRPFPGGSGKWQISTSGGTFPGWTKGGREIIYLGSDGAVTAVPIDYAGGFRPGRESTLFRLQKAPTHMEVFPDGERIAVATFGAAVDIDRLVIVVNWMEELERTQGRGTVK